MAAAIFAPLRAESSSLSQGTGPAQNEKTSILVPTTTTPSPPNPSSDRKRAWDAISDDKPRLFDVQVVPTSARPQTPPQPQPQAHQHYGAPPPYSQTYTPQFQPQQQGQQSQMPMRPGEQPPPPPPSQSQSQGTPAPVGPQPSNTLPPLRDVVRRHVGAAPLSPLMTASPATTSFGNYPRGSVDTSPFTSTPNFDQRQQQWPARMESQASQSVGSPRPGGASNQLNNPPVEFHGQAAQDQHRHPGFQPTFAPHAQQPQQQQGYQQSPYPPLIQQRSISVHPAQPLYGSAEEPPSPASRQLIPPTAQTQPLGAPSQQTPFETRTGFSYPPVHQYPSAAPSWPTNQPPPSTPQSNISPTSTQIPFPPSQHQMGQNDVQRVNEARRGMQVSAPHNNRFGNGIQTGLGEFNMRLQLHQIKQTSVELDRFADFYLNRIPTSPNQEHQNRLVPAENLPTVDALERLMQAHGQTYRALDTLRMAIMQAEQDQKTQMAAAQAFAEKQAVKTEAMPDSSSGPSSSSIGGEGKKRRGRHAEGGHCHSCFVSDTPEWRKGPDGARTLCNACGLHYAKVMRKAANEKKEADASDPQSLSQVQAEFSWNNRASGSTVSSAGGQPMSTPSLLRSDTSAATLVSVLSADGDMGMSKMSDVENTGKMTLPPPPAPAVSR